MFARAMVIKVNPGCEVELTRTFEEQVIPRLRKEKDFRGLVAFTVPDGTEAQVFGDAFRFAHSWNLLCLNRTR